MKNVLLIAGGIGVLFIGTILFVMTNLDDLVKDAIQSFGSETIKTEVQISDLELALRSGQVTIKGLNVSNPEGFSDPNIFELTTISIKIDPATLNQNPIVIDEIIISAPTVVYEINKSGVSNADVLKNNMSRAGRTTDSDSGGIDDLKMIIRKLIVEGGKAKMRIAALGDAAQTVILPEIRLTDIGKKSGGVKSAELARIISSKLLGNVNSSVAAMGVGKYLGKATDGQIGNRVSGAAKKVGGDIKGLLSN